MQATIQLSERVESIRFPVDVIDAFLGDLRSAGYASNTLIKRRWVLSAFARWATSQRIKPADFDDTVVDAFLSLASPRHITVLPGGGSLARAR